MTLDAGIQQPIVPVQVPHCPICDADLQLGSTGTLHHWSCPQGHGLAMTLTESYERLQEDEIAELWRRARTAAPGPLPSPFDRTPMARFEIAVDVDEVAGGDGSDVGSVVVDVDVENQFIWLDAGELDEFPADVEDAPPSPDQVAKEAEIVARFGADIEADVDEREGQELTEQLYRRVAHHPGALGALDAVGRTVTTY
jgi:Zn-finger nucleic acid-binding protein